MRIVELIQASQDLRIDIDALSDDSKLSKKLGKPASNLGLS
jgi:hypothetical protein